MHGIHVLCGMAVITWVLIRAAKGEFSAEYYTPSRAFGIFWHIVDLVWIFPYSRYFTWLVKKEFWQWQQTITNIVRIMFTPMSVYIKVAVALYVFTVLTVVAHYFEHALGPMAAPIALLIATFKAALVMLYFMGLKYDDNQNANDFWFGLFLSASIYFFSVLDILTRITQTSTL